MNLLEHNERDISVLGKQITPALMNDMQSRLNAQFAYGVNPLDICSLDGDRFIALIVVIGNWPDCKITLNGRPFLVYYDYSKPDVFRYAVLDDKKFVLSVITALAENNIIWSSVSCEDDKSVDNYKPFIITAAQRKEDVYYGYNRGERIYEESNSATAFQPS